MNLLFMLVDSYQSTDTEKMIIHIVKMLVHWHSITQFQLVCLKIILKHALEISTEWESFPIGSLNVVSFILMARELNSKDVPVGFSVKESPRLCLVC